jgi:hypothetical protein
LLMAITVCPVTPSFAGAATLPFIARNVIILLERGGKP